MFILNEISSCIVSWPVYKSYYTGCQTLSPSTFPLAIPRFSYFYWNTMHAIWKTSATQGKKLTSNEWYFNKHVRIHIDEFLDILLIKPFAAGPKTFLAWISVRDIEHAIRIIYG